MFKQLFKFYTCLMFFYIPTLGFSQLKKPVNSAVEKKPSILKLDAITFKDNPNNTNEPIAYYKDLPYTGETWSYFTKPYTVQEKITWLNGVKNGPRYEYTEYKVLFNFDNWTNGIKNGPFEYFYPNGLPEAKGNFIFNKLDGTIYGWYNNGKYKYISEYKNGIRNGKNLTFFIDGDIEQIATFNTDYPNGSVYSYYQDSVLRSEIEYTYGIKTGKSYMFHVSGCPAEEAYYKNGKLDSIFRVYDELTCKLLKQVSRKNGLLHGTQLVLNFYGDTLEQSSFLNGLQTGVYKQYNFYENNALEKDANNRPIYSKESNLKIKIPNTLGNYENGKKTGYWYYAMDDYKKLRHGKYQNGLMVGTWFFYDVDGYLIFTNLYGENEEITKQKFYKPKKKYLFKYPHKNELL